MDWDSIASNVERKIRLKCQSIARRANDDALMRLYNEADNPIIIEEYEKEMRKRHLI